MFGKIKIIENSFIKNIQSVSSDLGANERSDSWCN